MYENENGMTLVEVLATLVIASLFMGIIWAIFTISLDYNTVETKKARLQQEANYIFTELQRTHRQNDYYKFTLLEDKLVINECKDSVENCYDDDNEKIISNGYLYDGEIEGCFENKDCLVDSKNGNLTLNDFKISDSKNDNLSVKISTVISRYIDK